MHCFKEWQIICDALKSGQQSLILRKGGIHEGKEGFHFGSIERFLLFPTRFHAQGEQVTQAGSFTPGKEWEIGDEVVFDTVCEVVDTYELTEWARVQLLAPYHIWSESCLQARFDWEGKGMMSGKIHLAVVRVSTLTTPLKLEYSKKLGGCRSWVEVAELTVTDPVRTPVLTDLEFTALRASIQSLITA